MRLLKHISKDKHLSSGGNFKTREASRAIAFDEEGLIPLLFVSKFKYHKLPGGGLEGKEDVKEACKRELLEETGCVIEIGEEVGMVTECREKWNLHQTSYCFFGKILKKGKTSFEQSEIDDGFQLVWMTLDEAIKTLEDDKPQSYEGEFIQQRDLAFLKEAKRLTS